MCGMWIDFPWRIFPFSGRWDWWPVTGQMKHEVKEMTIRISWYPTGLGIIKHGQEYTTQSGSCKGCGILFKERLLICVAFAADIVCGKKLQWCGEMSEWTQKLFILLENKLLLNIGGNIVHFDKRIINFIWRTVEPQILSVWMKYIRAVMRLVNVMISVSFVIVKVHNWGIEIVAAGHRLTQGWLCAAATYDGHTRVMTWSTWVGGI